MVNINPVILKWARETAGINIDDACRKLGIKGTRILTAHEKLIALENGNIEPNRNLLVKMAKQYHRPLIIFYMDEPPKKEGRGQDFRSLAENYPKESIALVDAIVRNVIVRQSIVRAALEDEEDVESISFIGSAKVSDGISKLVDQINQIIRIDINKFYKQPSLNDAFSLLRAQIESAGVFVLLIGDLGSHHSDVDIKAFRGFALADQYAPFIVINDNDSKAAWSFTLIHELTHLLLGQTGISGTSNEIEVEQFCNSVAGNFLLPDNEVIKLKITHDLDKGEMMKKISTFSKDRNISSSMVVYNLYLKGKISKDLWNELNEAYRDLWEKNKRDKKSQKKEGSGPDYYIVKKHRLGNGITQITQQMLAGGLITTTEAGKVLGIKPQNVQKLFELEGHR